MTEARPKSTPSSLAEFAAESGVKHLVIACTLRSGSNLLGEVLRRNGFGEPKEWFQVAPGFAPGTTQSNHTDASLIEFQTQKFMEAHASARWRGVKFELQQFLNLRALAPNLPGTASVLQELLGGHWIFLLRRNLAHQAVSLYAAQLTGAWMGEETADYGRVSQDFDSIYERFAAITADMYAWEEFFRAGGRTPVRLFQEDMVGGDSEAWLSLLRRLAPEFDPGQLDLTALQPPPKEHPQLRALKAWFHEQIMVGRRPRSVLALLEEIGQTVTRVERMSSVETVLGRFAADVMAHPGGFCLRKLALGHDLELNGQAALVRQEHFLDREALRLDPDATCGFAAQAMRVMLQFYTHAWSGIAEIWLGETVEKIDLFSERPDTRHFIRDLSPDFSGMIVVRCSGEKNLLSEGMEVWLQRALLLTCSGA